MAERQCLVPSCVGCVAYSDRSAMDNDAAYMLSNPEAELLTAKSHSLAHEHD